MHVGWYAGCISELCSQIHQYILKCNRGSTRGIVYSFENGSFYIKSNRFATNERKKYMKYMTGSFSLQFPLIKETQHNSSSCCRGNGLHFT